MSQLIAELVRKTTRTGGSFFLVGTVPDPAGGHFRLMVFFRETRRDEHGDHVDVWELRREHVDGRPIPSETAPSKNRRLGAEQRDGGRPQPLTGYRLPPSQRWRFT